MQNQVVFISLFLLIIYVLIVFLIGNKTIQKAQQEKNILEKLLMDDHGYTKQQIENITFTKKEEIL